MGFDRRDHNIEEWLAHENNGQLEKICTLYDGLGRITEVRKTRVNILPIGVADIKGVKSLSAPSLRRRFIYDSNGNFRTTVPEMVEWDQACEDIAQGVDPSYPPINIGDLPLGLTVAKVSYKFDEQLAVAYNVETTVVSFTVPAENNIYLRHIVGSGENKATYRVDVDGDTKQKKRTWWGKFNADFDFSSSDGGLYIEGGSTVSLKVINESNFTATFDGSIGYVLV